MKSVHATRSRSVARGMAAASIVFLLPNWQRRKWAGIALAVRRDGRAHHACSKAVATGAVLAVFWALRSRASDRSAWTDAVRRA